MSGREVLNGFVIAFSLLSFILVLIPLPYHLKSPHTLFEIIVHSLTDFMVFSEKHAILLVYLLASLDLPRPVHQLHRLEWQHGRSVTCVV